MDAKKLILIFKLEYSPVFIHTMVGILLGYFVLHPITMAIYWFEINNTIATLQSLTDAFNEEFMDAFYLHMMPMSVAFIIIGGITGLSSGLFFRKIHKQGRELQIKQYQLNDSLEKLEKLNNLLEEKVAELNKTNNEKDIFFSIIAHDMRGPFNGFLGLTQIMVEESSNFTRDEIRDIAISMNKSAINLAGLLENLLKWAKMLLGLIPFDPKVVELLPIVNESITMVLEPAKKKGIEIAYDIQEDLTVFADSNMLQFVIRNLVSNAVKFTHKGGKINVLAKSTGDNVEISIKDSGIGMNSTMVDHLFRLDVQTNRKGTEGESSSGLGLPLSKKFIEIQRGKIWVESEAGKGSIFYFTIPGNG